MKVRAATITAFMVSVVTVTTATLQPHMFITGAMDSEDGWKIATFGYSLAAPGGLFLVAVRHGICKVTAESSAVDPWLANILNSWALAHGTVTWFSLLGAAACQVSSWPVAHNTATGSFFFNAVAYMMVSCELDTHLGAHGLTISRWPVRTFCIWSLGGYLVCYIIYACLCLGEPICTKGVEQWVALFEKGVCGCMLIFWLSYVPFFIENDVSICLYSTKITMQTNKVN